MMRWIGLGFVILLLGVGWVAFSHPEWIPGDQADFDITNLVWLVMALLLVSGAAYGFPQIRAKRGAAVAGLLFWPAAIVVIVLLYNWFG